jgi:hypothetical protein
MSVESGMPTLAKGNSSPCLHGWLPCCFTFYFVYFVHFLASRHLSLADDHFPCSARFRLSNSYHHVMLSGSTSAHSADVALPCTQWLVLLRSPQ